MVRRPAKQPLQHVKMVAAFADYDRRAPFAHAVCDVARDHGVAGPIVNEFRDHVGELRLPFAFKRTGLRYERRGAHPDDVPKGREGIHLPGVDAIADGTAFHLNYGMLSVVADNRRREAEEVPCRRCVRDPLERRSRNRMAFVDDHLSVALQRRSKEFVLHAGKRLDDGNVYASVGLVCAASNPPDVLRGHTKELRETSHPLGLQLAAVDEH